MEEFTFEKVKRFCTRARRRQRVDDDDEEEDDFARKLAALDSKLIDFFSTEDASFKLETELLIFVSYGRPLAQACYFLEGDRPLLPYVEESLRRCRLALSSSTDPTPSSFDPHSLSNRAPRGPPSSSR